MLLSTSVLIIVVSVPLSSFSFPSSFCPRSALFVFYSTFLFFSFIYSVTYPDRSLLRMPQEASDYFLSRNSWAHWANGIATC